MKRIRKDTKKVPEQLIDVKFKIEKRVCIICSKKFQGTRYQRWCTGCKENINKINPDWALWT